MKRFTLPSGFANPPATVRFGICLAAVVFSLSESASSANLLVNPSFEQNSGHVVALGWTYFSPPPPPGYFGDYWIEGNVTPHAGRLYWKQWSALDNAAITNVTGIYQDLSSSPGATYQARGWIYSDSHDNGGLGSGGVVWFEVAFLGGSSNVLALYKSANYTAGVGLDRWFPYESTNACDPSQPLPSGDPYFTTYAVTGTVSQMVAPVGTQKLRYRFCLSQNVVKGSCYFDDAVLDQISGPVAPVISNLFPRNMIFVNPNEGLSFNVSSPSGFTINSNAIGLLLNGQDVSSGLVITGSASNKNVAYYGLLSNSTYTASVTVTDTFNLTASATSYFETTWVGTPPLVYLWEAEDWDFTNGTYINFPELCDTPNNPNCYFSKVGTEGVDEHNLHAAPNHLYRPDDPMGTVLAGDYAREDHVLANLPDYRVDPFNGGEWLNYTRDWSNGTFWVVGRLSTDIGLSGSLTLSQVNPDATTTDLGTFNIANGQGWTSFQNVLLKDTNGTIAAVTLNGKTTLRVTSGGNLLANFFALAPAQLDLPEISNLYPDGAHPFEATNAISFTVTTRGSTFPPGGIKLFLDGFDVSSKLSISGPGSAASVLYPGLMPDAVHTAIITITNSLGHGIALTNRFDTFSEDNFMIEAEDFDYAGGQFIPAGNWLPDAYANLGATTNIDFQHSPIDGEQFPYRTEGIPEEKAQDYLRQVFVDFGAFDYHLAWFGPGDWANYTRDFPPGSYYVYTRAAGLGQYTMFLDAVISGAGSSNQVTSRLGRWDALGRDNQTHDWVLLTDEGLAAPAKVTLGGVATVRLSTTTGFCYPNYFMLVPVAGIPLSADISNGSVNISFPTQSGVPYRVFYRENLSGGSWTPLMRLLGDGTTRRVVDSSAASQRYYRVVAP